MYAQRHVHGRRPALGAVKHGDVGGAEDGLQRRRKPKESLSKGWNEWCRVGVGYGLQHRDKSIV